MKTNFFYFYFYLSFNILVPLEPFSEACVCVSPSPDKKQENIHTRSFYWSSSVLHRVLTHQGSGWTISSLKISRKKLIDFFLESFWILLVILFCSLPLLLRVCFWSIRPYVRYLLSLLYCCCFCLLVKNTNMLSNKYWSCHLVMTGWRWRFLKWI